MQKRRRTNRRKAFFLFGAIIALCIFIAIFLFYPAELDIELVEIVDYDPENTVLPPETPEWWEQAGRYYKESAYNNAFDWMNEGFGLTEKLNRLKTEYDQK